MPDESALERLSKKLDAGTAESGIRRRPLFTKASGAPDAWQEESASGEKPMAKRRKRRYTPLEIVFGGAMVFFLIAVAVAGLIIFSGNNTISSKNVDVQITGPTEVGAGSTLSLQVVVTNRNSVPMQLTDLVIDFPPGTRSDTDATADMPNTRISLGTINPGESVNRTVRATIFGTAGQNLTIHASAEYRVPSSNAVYVRDADYTTRINQSPVAITTDALTQAVSGQSNDFTVTVTSNAQEVLKNMLLIANYPPGFAFASSDPKPVSGTAVWNLGDIQPGGSRTVKISGSFTGEDGDSRDIIFNTGTQTDNQPNQIVAPLATSDLSVTIAKPFVSVALALNGSVADTHTILPGMKVSGTITWTNNLSVPVENLVITLSLTGSVLDPTGISASNGFYNSGANTITWDSTTDPDLANVAPGASNAFNYTIATLPSNASSYTNPQVHLSVDVKGDRQSETGVPSSVESTATTIANVESALTLVPTLSRLSGPVPPKTGAETDYEVTWSVANSSNPLANAVVSAILPSYVKFLKSDSGSAISFNASTHVITWTVGDMSGGAAQNGMFEIGITPSVSQIGTLPDLVGNERVDAYDRFARTSIDSTAATLTTASVGGDQAQGVVSQ